MLIAGAAFLVARRVASSVDGIKGVHWILLILIIVLNGCLIYTSAFGIQNNVIAKGEAEMTFTEDRAPADLSFRSPW
jgi:hypothetical protein